MNWFIAGTDTGVGKTRVMQMLIKAGRKAGLDTAGFKPICCGDRGDAHALHLAADREVPLDTVNPVWLRPEASPYTASMIEERPIDLALIHSKFALLRKNHKSLLVEGVGGWKVPVTRDTTTADLAVRFALPVVLVVHNRLGAINHALLTLESIASHGLRCDGLIINQFGEIDPIPLATNKSILEDITGLPVLFDISEGQNSLTLGLG